MTQALAERTAEREGAFFLPHVQPSMRLLDVGCGPGSITIGFARVVSPGEVVGIDREPTAVDAARTLANDQHLANLRFEVGTAEALPFPDASFTAVFAHTLLEHVPDPSLVLREMRRVLAPGGVIGVRDGDVGARLQYPPDDTAQEALVLYERLWQHNGGKPQQGRLQRTLLHAAGFTRLLTSTGTNHFPPAFAAEFFAQRLTMPPVSTQLIELGWSDAASLDRLGAGLREWGHHPDAIWSTMMVETVGWAE
jgi:SAM-dependent methyltransferase